MAPITTKEKKSKREKQKIFFEKDAEWVQAIPYEIENEFPQIIPNNVVNSVDLKNKTKGWVRLLQTRFVFKAPPPAIGHKERQMDINYSQIERRHVLERHPEVLVLGVYNPTNVVTRHYEVLRFKDQQSVTDCLNVLGNFTSNNNFAEDNAHADPPVTSESPKDYYELDEKTVFVDDVEFRQFDMHLFDDFPAQLPAEVMESLKDKNLDEQGSALIYPDGITVNTKQGDRMWTTNYNRVYTMYNFETDPNYVLLAVDNKAHKPEHYSLLKFSKNDSVKKLKSTYDATGGQIKSIKKAVTPQPVALKPVEQAKPLSYKIEDSRTPSPEFIREPTPQTKVHAAAPIKGHSDSTSGFTLTRGSYDTTTTFRRKQNNAKRSSMLNVPDNDDSEWERNIAYLQDDPINGARLVNDGEGSVVLFVARKLVA